MNSSAENHNQKDLKPPSRSVTGPPSAPPPLHVQSQPQVPWSTGLFDCCQDVRICCLTYWCPCITLGRIAEIVDRGSTSCGASGARYMSKGMAFGTPFLYSCSYRTKLRAQFHLQGNQCKDCLIHGFCETCALCQEYRELKNRGFDMEMGWHANKERRTPGTTTVPPSVTGGMSR